MTKKIWKVDPGHSQIGFAAKHLMIAKTRGTFDDFEARIDVDIDDLTNDPSVEIDILSSSVNSRNEKRDGHLRSEEFFDIENYPLIKYRLKRASKIGENLYEVDGELQMRETVKDVVFEVKLEGKATDPVSGDSVAGFSGITTINRQDYGLSWTAGGPNGDSLIGDDIELSFELELRSKE